MLVIFFFLELLPLFLSAEPAVVCVASTAMLSHTGGTTVDLRESWISQGPGPRLYWTKRMSSLLET